MTRAVFAAHATEALVGVDREQDGHCAPGLGAAGGEAEVPGPGPGILDHDLLIHSGGQPPGVTALVQHTSVTTPGASPVLSDRQRPVALGQAARHRHASAPRGAPEDRNLDCEAPGRVCEVSGELEDGGGGRPQGERGAEADITRPHKLGAASSVSPPGQHQAQGVAALGGGACLEAVGLEQHLDRPQVWLPAQQRGVDGVDQQRPGTGGGFLAA